MDLKEYADMINIFTFREKLSFWKGFTVGILFLILSLEICFTVIGIFGAVV